MKKKLKADNVEGLLEIVKAIQNGEDPEEVLKRKEAERLMAEMEAERIAAEKEEQERAARKEAAELAAREAEEKRAAREAEKQAKKKNKKRTESAPEADSPKSRPEETDSEAKTDEFEELLNEEETKGLSVRESLSGVFAGLQGLIDSLGSAKKKSSVTKKKRTNKEEAEDEILTEPEDGLEQAGSEAEESENTVLKEEAVEANFQPEESEQPEAAQEERIHNEPEQTSEKTEPVEKSEDEQIFERLLERNGISPDEVEADDPEEDADKEKADTEEADSEETKTSGKFFAGIKDYGHNLLQNLKQRGISKKEIIMIIAGVILAVLVVAFVWKGINSVIIQRKKSENVTADKGLTVTVEKEPDQWSAWYPVELRYKASGSNIRQISVNGVNYLPSETGMITVETGEWLLDTTVLLEDGTQLGARIEIPMLDDQVPVVEAQRSQNTITLTAADARSDVKQIWYGEVSVHTPWVIPKYQKYAEPLTFHADTLYYFFAEDMAGNRSVPKKTTMEAAETMELSTAELALFPGETKTLQVVTTPAHALLSNLRFESTDASVATVDGAGNVTAVSEGTAAIKVTAQGPNDTAEAAMSCVVSVSKSRTITISAIGDCTLGTDESFNTMTNFNAFDAVNGHGYFFSKVKEILLRDDVTFANLEGTFTKETTREIKEYAFKGDPSYTEVLKHGSVEVVTLANNHSRDYGEKSLEDTKGYLTEAEIDYCIGDTIAMREVNGVPVAFIGIYVLKDGMEREAQVRETIARAKELGAQLVIVGFHWGSEKAKEPDDIQTSLAHLAVDCGANLVVGHHPHVLQGIEKYNGVYIVYSLGNFCFGGNSTPSDMDTMIFQQQFTITEGIVMDDDQVAVIPCSISSTPNYNNYQPIPANGAEADRIMQKINGYSSVYGLEFEASSGL